MKRIERNDAMRGATIVLGMLVSSFLSGCADQPGPHTYLSWNVQEPAPQHWPAPTYVTVVVRPHDTVQSVAARYDVSESSVRHLNAIGPGDSVHAGDVLRIPPRSERTRAAVVREADSQRIYAQPHDTDYVNEHVTTQPLKPVNAARNDPPPHAAPAPHDEDVAEVPSGAMHFAWPVEGRVISPYGSTSNGERNDGINISAAEGAPVRAAADGTVTYVGNEFHAYGNIVIIKHTGGYITVYAHEQSIGVAKGQQVSRSQVIGTAGRTGGVEQPEVHFEVRYQTRPVNPGPLLSQTVARASS
jgi:murein DD-endopeptidase MepM/ murein hydrolase activator NlpD